MRFARSQKGLSGMPDVLPPTDPVVIENSAASLRPRRRVLATLIVFMLAIAVVTMAIVAFQWPPDGSTRGDDGWRFAGRLHPMLVHVPIGLLLLVPILEFCGIPRRLRHLQATAGFVLWLGTLTAILAAAHGYVLARFDGISGERLMSHQWWGVGTAALAVLTLALRYASVPALPRGVVVPVASSGTPTTVAAPLIARRRAGATILYILSLGGLGAAMSIAGHLGGQMVYGPNYLSSVAPPAIAGYLGPMPRRGATPSASPAATTPAPMSVEPTSFPTTRSSVDRVPASAPVVIDAVIVEPQPAVDQSFEATTRPATQPAEPPLADAPVTFASSVLPVFSLHCVSCHGPDKVKGGLRLESLAELRVGGDSGDSIVAGNPTASDLYDRMTLPLDDDMVMPPANAKRRPTSAEIEVVRRWILDGARE
jgi:uncharacterized membrane protein/mono/diheme cytochrome c family protein